MLQITDVPPDVRTDEGFLLLTDEMNPTAAIPRSSIGRNVKDLPKLIARHEELVRKLESVLAKYLRNPDRLPANRPTMRPFRDDRAERGNAKVDAIDYLTEGIQRLEEEVRHVRGSIDKRNAMPYGFVSWEKIEHAHAVAYVARNKHPRGTTFRLAPRPQDLIWENLALSKSTRKWKKFAMFLWVTALTIVWIAPNALIAIFLSNLSNLGLVWPAFQTSLNANSRVWAAVQGILSPAVTALFYLILPIIFRRLSTRTGDATKFLREQHVLRHLYSFFVFNNLIVFSLFSAVWTFVAAVIDLKNKNEDPWQAVRDGKFYAKAVSALCQVSPFWITYILQRNIGAAIDLAQLVNLVWVWFAKTFLAPTPRQTIEWTAPPSFDYASYYTYFLYYATIAICFATLQPIVLPVTALYFGLDAMMKKYMLMYIFVTKNESGGQWWRVLFNRLVFATILANVIIGCVAKAKGTWNMVFCIVPLPFLMLLFKWYCLRTFDHDCTYYNRATMSDAEALAVSKSTKSAGDRLSSKFGHPALYRQLITPMVHAKAGDALKQIYRGRLGATEIDGEYSDIAMDPMIKTYPGKAMQDPSAPFEMVPEHHLDFAYYKDRADFQDEFGGGIYGRPDDLITERSQTPRSTLGDWSPTSSRASSPAPSVPSLPILQPEALDPRLNSPHPAFRPPPLRSDSAMSARGLYQHQNESETELLGQAQQPAGSNIPPWRPGGGYGPVDQDDPTFTSYEHYRTSR